MVSGRVIRAGRTIPAQCINADLCKIQSITPKHGLLSFLFFCPLCLFCGLFNTQILHAHEIREHCSRNQSGPLSVLSVISSLLQQFHNGKNNWGWTHYKMFSPEQSNTVVLKWGCLTKGDYASYVHFRNRGDGTASCNLS